MLIKLLLNNGFTFEVGEKDWIGALVHYDLERDVIWTESFHDKNELIQALRDGRVLCFDVGGRKFNVDSENVVEAKAIEDGKEILLWIKAVRSNS